MSFDVRQGDCVELMAAMPAGSVDAVVCDPPTGYWVAGLIDGEGCFRIHKQKRGEWYAPTFSLKLRDDDLPILQEVAMHLGIGSVKQDATGRGTSKPCAVWRVQSRADCLQLAKVLDLYPLRTRKARDYAVWRRALDVAGAMPKGNRWHGPRDWSPLIDLKRELEQAREYVPPEGR